MSSAVATSLLGAIVLLYTCLALHSYKTAVLGYLTLAPISYCSIWTAVTWDPERACTALLVIVCLTRYGDVVHLKQFWRHGIALVFLFCIGTTIVNSFFWPTDMAWILSAAYGRLRVVVQVAQLCVNVLAVWCLVPFFRNPRNRSALRKAVVISVIFLCGYGAYQVVAYHTGLPATGIRRAYTRALTGSYADEYPTVSSGPITTLRASSLLGEPKTFGAACAVWLAILVATSRSKKGGFVSLAAYTLAGLGLLLSYSTSAWIAFCAALLLSFRRAFQARRTAVPVGALSIVVVAALVLAFASGGGMSEIAGGLIRARTVERTSSVSDAIGDFAEQQTIQILQENPVLAIAGAGMGGISFYIEQNAQTQKGLIFAPNNGVLAIISEIGVVGLLLYFLVYWRPLFECAFKRRRTNTDYDWLIFPGAMATCLCLIHGVGWISTTGFAICIAIGQLQFRASKLPAGQVMPQRVPSDGLPAARQRTSWGPVDGGNEQGGQGFQRGVVKVPDATARVSKQ